MAQVRLLSVTSVELTVVWAIMMLLPITVCQGAGKNTNLTEARMFLEDYTKMAEIVKYQYSEATWAYYTNITLETSGRAMDAELQENRFLQEAARNASMFDLAVMMDPTMKREFIKIMDIGTAAQTNETKLKRFSQVKQDMEKIYDEATVCLERDECVPLNPGLEQLFATSRDPEKLKKAWKGWRDATGAKMRYLYPEYVTLSNEAVRILGHADTGAYWRSWYDTPEFQSDVAALFDQLRPLYEHLHAYTRRKLKVLYGAEMFPESGHIPAHLLGNMWAQIWSNLVQELTPYKNKTVVDVTEEMRSQNYTVLKLYQTADDFFGSLGMIKMPEAFWNKSMLTKPTDGRSVACHAMAWDFSNRKDFRILHCAKISQEDLVIAHHEMGHIEYFLQYKDQPMAFRDGANPGFHEAVGDVITLSVLTPGHLKSIGLLQSVTDNKESDVNFQMSMALAKIAFLPFGFLVDQWRWSVFRGDTKPEEYTKHWWELRCRYQGVSPPMSRSSSDFDPGAKNHIATDTPYIRYFVSFVIQFQFHKALCDAANYTGPLHRCDIYNSKEAGALLSKMLQMGSSKPWTEAMKMLTGQTKMDARPLMDYFRPLMEFLRQENGNDYGWHPHCPEDSPRDGSDRSRLSLFTAILTLLMTCLLVCM